MICIEGKTAFSGIAIGPIREFAKKSSAVRRSHVDDTAAECTRFEEAKKVAMEELGALYDKAVKEVGEDNAAIFEVHQIPSATLSRHRRSMQSLPLPRQGTTSRRCSPAWMMST